MIFDLFWGGKSNKLGLDIVGWRIEGLRNERIVDWEWRIYDPGSEIWDLGGSHLPQLIRLKTVG